jgi:transposase, IS5 family
MGEEFVEARRQHAAVESGIAALENHGLDRCLDNGLRGFQRYVALAVVARNLQVLGTILWKKEELRRKREAPPRTRLCA